MKLIIYNSILHDSLQSQSVQTPANYSEISYLLNKRPETLPEIKTCLQQVLGSYLSVDFNEDMPVSINQYFNNQDYTFIEADYFLPNINLPLLAPQTPIQRFYYFVITTEAERIKLLLLQSIEMLKDDICAKQEIKDTLAQLARHAKTIGEQPQSNEILAFLLTQITKLYFEITLIFDVLLTEQDYISFTDFYSIRLNRQADETSISAYNAALHIHQAQHLYANFDNKAIRNSF